MKGERIEIYPHEINGVVYYTDSTDPTNADARTFEPYGADDSSVWVEVRDGAIVPTAHYEYWPSDGLLTEL